MCVIGAKYLEDNGWIGFKNRDRNYFATVEITSEFSGLEKLMIRDSMTRYSEGINEKGISILSSCLAVKDDEDEIMLARDRLIELGEYQSPIGQAFKAALSLPTLDSVIQYLIDRQAAGHTLIFNADTLYILEGAFQLDPDGSRTEHYEYHIEKIDHADGQIVRTNHGIRFPYAGYQYDERHWDSRVSSEERLDQVKSRLELANSKDEIIEAFSSTFSENAQHNPLRLDHAEENMKTTGQIMIIPKSNELWYRPVLGKVTIDHHTFKTNKNTFRILREIGNETIKTISESMRSISVRPE